MINKLELQKVFLEKNMSQRKLAFAMGKSPNTIGKWLNGKAFPSTKEVCEMCAILDITDNDKKALIFLSEASHI